MDHRSKAAGHQHQVGGGLCKSHGDPLWDPIQRLRVHIHKVSCLLIGDFPFYVSWELTLLVSKVWLVQGVIDSVTRKLDIITQTSNPKFTKSGTAWLVEIQLLIKLPVLCNGVHGTLAYAPCPNQTLLSCVLGTRCLAMLCIHPFSGPLVGVRQRQRLSSL